MPESHTEPRKYTRRPPTGGRAVCSFDGCNRPVDAKGYCPAHYRQYTQGKTLRPINAYQKDSTITCEHCGHVFYPRKENHLNRCVRCRNRFETTLSLLRQKTANAPAGKRWCQGCEKYRAERFFPSTEARCRPCLKKHSADRRAQKVYSLEPGMYEKLYNHQEGKCYICRRATGKTRSLSVDHDHSCCPGQTSCGKCVRGLLCGGCNYKILGHLRDDIEALQRAINYLTNPPAAQIIIGERIVPGHD